MNTEKIRLIQLIDRLPDSLVRTVLDFVDFLLWKQGRQPQNSSLSEADPSSEDLAWLNSNLSNLDAHEPYEWAEGELEQGKPIKYVPDKGFVIEE
jgi:hypothetical protein